MDKSIEPDDPTEAPHLQFIDAVKAGAVSRILSTFCEDAVWMPQNETSLFGIEEVREWFEDYFQYFEVTAYAITEREVHVIGDWAVERNAYMVAIAPVRGGERIRDDGRFLTVWKRTEDGSWKISQSMMNSMRPVGSGTSRFMARMIDKKNEGGSP